MADHGFYITNVRLTGAGVDDAEIALEDGFNVIFGASNTGKTFISQCVDFAFGRTDHPKAIPEARAYEQVHVTIRARETNETLVLRRSLRGGDIAAVMEDGEKLLSTSHSDRNSDNISSLLLKMCGLLGRRVTENGRGKTRSLSFRDLTRLVIINEERIIKSDSPMRSSSYTENTVRQSVFRLLLSGVDDSSIVEKKEAKVSKAEARGKGEVLESLESELLNQIASFKSSESVGDLISRKERLDSAANSIADSLTTQRENYAIVEADRRRIWTRLQQVESRQEVVSQLLARFILLSEQYDSDLERLASIAEVGNHLGELKQERCPVCGAPAEHHDVEHSEQESSPEAVASSASAERNKIRQLKSDLVDTIRQTGEERDTLISERSDLEESLTEIIQRLQNEYQPRVAAALEQYQQIMAERARVGELLGHHERLERIIALRAEAELQPAEKSDSTVVTKVSSGLAEPFCQEVERLLEEWKLPDRGRVTFSEDSQDIVIAGRDRSVDGKGVRAITHAAFSLALNNYCVIRHMPTPSFVILDSPLVVYRKPDDGEESFSPDVKTNFYRQMAAETVNRQVVVLENDDPPDDLESSVNVIHFTKSDYGRYGFIPRPSGKDQGENESD